MNIFGTHTYLNICNKKNMNKKIGKIGKNIKNDRKEYRDKPNGIIVFINII